MTELERNLNEVTDLAIKTGEQIVTVDCPCCGKTFYALRSEAIYSQLNPADNSVLKYRSLGRKCPHCGFAGGYDPAGGQKTKAEQDIEQMLIEMEAEQMAQEAADKRAMPWSKICNQELDFKEPKKDD